MTHDEARGTLNDFLNSPERGEGCFDIHQFEGAVAALLSCPGCVSEAGFGLLVLGKEAKGIDQWFEDERIRSAWMTCMRETGEALSMEQFTLKNRYAIEASATAPGEELSHWCDGYLQAYWLTEKVWVEAYDSLASENIPELNEDHKSFLVLLAVLANWNQALAEDENPDYLRSHFPLLFGSIDEAIVKMYCLAILLKDNRLQSDNTHETSVRESAKVGRNDPCPCGSGKKYKKCCLH